MGTAQASASVLLHLYMGLATWLSEPQPPHQKRGDSISPLTLDSHFFRVSCVGTASGWLLLHGPSVEFSSADWIYPGLLTLPQAF